MDSLYAGNRCGRAREAADEYVERLFTSGQSLACWLTSPEAEGSALVETLSVLKGPSDPADCRPGHVRHLLGAENRIMNGIHSSDSYELALNEIDILGIGDTWQPTDEAGVVPPPGAALPELTLSALAVACRLRAELVQAALGEVPVGLRTLQTQAYACAARRIKPRGVLAVLATLWKEHDVLLPVADYGLRERLDEVNRAIVRFDADQLRRLVAPYSISLSDWDDLVLRCQKHRGPLPHWTA